MHCIDFYCFSAQRPIAPNGRCSPLANPVLTALVLGIILGAVAATVTYFLAPHAIRWSAISGVSGMALTFLMTYATLRYCKTDPVLNKTTISEEQTEPTSNTKTMRHQQENIQSIPDNSSDHSPRISVRGTVYFENFSGGPIRYDQCFRFSQRLRDRNGEPIVITEDDIYLSLAGEVLEMEALRNTAFHFLTMDNVSTSSIYLPASLFEGVREGEKVQFFWDDRLIELTCCQASHPNPRCAITAFEEMLKKTKEWCHYNQIPYLFPKDMVKDGEANKQCERPPDEVTIDDFLQIPPRIELERPRFMGYQVGEIHTRLDAQTGHALEQIASFDFYENDKKDFQYEKLEYKEFDSNHFVFNLHRTRVDLSEIHLIESKEIGRLHQIWIVIPHCLDKNQILHKTSDTTITITQDQIIEYEPVTSSGWDLEWKIKKGHKKRMCNYHHGQYFMCRNWHDNQVTLSFNEKDYLMLNFSPKEKINS